MKIKYNKPNAYSCAGVRLLPGINVLRAEDFARIKDHPAFQSRVQSGLIELKAAESESVDLTADDVAELSDVEKLRELAAGKKTLKVTKVAIARLAEIDAASKE